MKQFLHIILSVVSIFFILLFTLFTGCSRATSFHSMDTFMSIEQWGGRNVVKKCRTEVARLEKLLSATNKNSVLSSISNNSNNLNQQITQLPVLKNNNFTDSDISEVLNILNYSLSVAKDTNGAFNPCMRRLSLLWGFTTKNYRIPTSKEITDTLKICDYNQVKINSNNTLAISSPQCNTLIENQTKNTNSTSFITAPRAMLFDLGGVAKGYAGDKVINILKGAGATGALVNLGGNIVIYGSKQTTLNKKQLVSDTWSIGIRNPKQNNTRGISRDICGILKVSGVKKDGQLNATHIITSGGYERYFEVNGKRYCHIIARNGYPVNNDLLSVTVISGCGAQSDSLATALFVMGSAEALKYCKGKDFCYIMICKNGEIIKSEGLDFTVVNNDYKLAK